MNNSMNVSKSADFRKIPETVSAEFISKLHQDGQTEAALYFEDLKQCALIHQRIEQATGLKFDVFEDQPGSNVAAFVETANDNNYISKSVLRQPNLADHAAFHEAEHRNNQIFSLNLQEITPAEQQILTQHFGLENLDETSLIEGFNEYSTFQKHGENNQSGYAKKEVPLAKKLENAVQQNLHISLLEIFRSKDAKQFIITLKQLATKLQMKETLGNLAPGFAQAA